MTCASPREQSRSPSSGGRPRRAKIVVAGVSGSGKTRMVRRFIYGDQSGDCGYIPTVEDRYCKTVNGSEIEIVDTGGLNRPLLQKAIPEWFRSADGVIFVYSSWEGYRASSFWVQRLQKMPKPPHMVAAYDGRGASRVCPFGLLHSRQEQAMDLVLSLMRHPIAKDHSALSPNATSRDILSLNLSPRGPRSPVEHSKPPRKRVSIDSTSTTTDCSAWSLRGISLD